MKTYTEKDRKEWNAVQEELRKLRSKVTHYEGLVEAANKKIVELVRLLENYK